MSNVSLSQEAAKARKYPRKFSNRERKLAQSVKTYVDGNVIASHKIAIAGNLTTIGGSSSESFSIPGLLVTDIVMLTLKTNPSAVAIRAHSLAANSLTITFSADPGTGVVVSYQIIRPA